MTKDVVIAGDIHSNALAVEALIEQEGSNKEYVITGDILGLNAQPSETVELLQSVEPLITLAGNHDRALTEFEEGHVNNSELSRFELEHSRSQLSQEQWDWVKGLPFLSVEEYADERICAAHAYPWAERASGYEMGNAGVKKRDLIEVASIVEDDYDFVMLAHTHQQYAQDCAKWGHPVHMINGGSLGYDGTYAVLDCDEGVELKQVEYDTEQLKAHIAEVLPADCPSVHQWYE